MDCVTFSSSLPSLCRGSRLLRRSRKSPAVPFSLWPEQSEGSSVRAGEAELPGGGGEPCRTPSPAAVVKTRCFWKDPPLPVGVRDQRPQRSAMETRESQRNQEREKHTYFLKCQRTVRVTSQVLFVDSFYKTKFPLNQTPRKTCTVLCMPVVHRVSAKPDG